MISFTEKVMQMLSVDEGVMRYVYHDITGHRTVGIGFNMDDPNARKIWIGAGLPEIFENVRMGLAPISYNSLIELLKITIEQAIQDTKKLVPDFDNLSEYQRMALINMAFQLGYNALSKFKNTLKAINDKDFTLARELALKSLWAKQTPARAKRVADMLIK